MPTSYPTTNANDPALFEVHEADSQSQSESDDAMLEESEASFHTMSTIQSEEVAEYFRLINGSTYESDENIPIYFPCGSGADRVYSLLHIIYRLARDGKNVSPAADEMLRMGGADGGGAPRVLDLITNSGIWACEMADMYQTATFVSLDTKPMVAHKPHPRINFEVYDLYAGIMERDLSFDLVHMRSGILVVRDALNLVEDHGQTNLQTKDFNFLLRELHRVLKPNGTLLIEVYPPRVYEGSFHEGPRHTISQYVKLLRLFEESWVSQGVDVATWDDLGLRLDPIHPHWGNRHSVEPHEERNFMPPLRGFQDVGLQIQAVPLGTWPEDERSKPIGALLQIFVESQLSSILSYIQMSGIEEREARALNERINLADISRYQLHYRLQYWSARKI